MDEYGRTEIHPLALLLTLSMGIAMLIVRRERAVVPFLLVACLVTHAQRVVVANLDFSMLRIVLLFGWARVLYRGETSGFRSHPLDKALLIWLAFGTIAYIIGPRGSTQAFVNRLGVGLDAAGTYFLFRMLLRDVGDLRRAVEAFSLIALVLVGPMLLEFLTGRNAFAVLGGVPEHTVIRDGRLRCQGAFSHAIMAGNFGASTAALVAGQWLGDPARRARHGTAFAAAVGVTILSASSGPLMALLAAVLGWSLWPYRRHMPLLRWGTLALLIVVHFAREQPVWHLIGRLSAITGGTGWHRVALINAAIEHFDEWWLLGTSTTAHWKQAQGSDITNQYILEGVRGGLATLLAFLTVLVIAFRTVGQSLRRAQAREDWAPLERHRVQLLAWGLGVCLAVHCVAFVGVSYFGQMLAILYLHLALVPALACALARAEVARVARAAERPGGVPRRRAGARAPA